MDEKSDDIETADNLIRDLQRRLAREIVRGDRMERRFNEASASSRAKDRTLQRLKEELEATRHELALVEIHLDEAVGQSRPPPETVLNLSGVTLLYVGGRANQIPRLKALVERVGARFLHHDGGLEQNVALLPSLVSRADHVTFPVDCVSHDKRAPRASHSSSLRHYLRQGNRMFIQSRDRKGAEACRAPRQPLPYGRGSD